VFKTENGESEQHVLVLAIIHTRFETPALLTLHTSTPTSTLVNNEDAVTISHRETDSPRVIMKGQLHKISKYLQ
jgi:hypothetical protein